MTEPTARILTRAELLARFGRPRSGTLVFTNGVFDLLHRGHVELLLEARRLGSALVVAVNTDDSVRRLEKGPSRPITPEQDRAWLLASLSCVDAVILFDEDTPHALIAALLPDILVKGGDYRAADVVGAAEVEEAGGRVVILPLLPGRSTTGIIDRIRRGSG